MISDYDIHGCLRLRLQTDKAGGRIDEHLRPFRVAEAAKVDATLCICRSPGDVPRDLSGGFFSESYKGVSWSLAFDNLDKGENSRIYFYAPLPFVDFLVVRIVLLPVLRSSMVALGGFATLGSILERDGTVLFVFGAPGCGKTRLALDGIEAGCRFVGDNEILVLPRGEMRSLFDEIELRRATVAGTKFWRRLDGYRRFQLLLCSLISSLSLRRVSFNISVRPALLGIQTVPASPESQLVFICLGSADAPERMSGDEVATALFDYEAWFHSVYGRFLVADRETYRSQFMANCSRAFRNCRAWRMPVGCGIRDVLAVVRGEAGNG